MALRRKVDGVSKGLISRRRDLDVRRELIRPDNEKSIVIKGSRPIDDIRIINVHVQAKVG